MSTDLPEPKSIRQRKSTTGDARSARDRIQERQEQRKQRRQQRLQHAREVLLEGKRPYDVEKAMQVFVEEQIQEQIDCLRQKLRETRAKHRERLNELRAEEREQRRKQRAQRKKAWMIIEEIEKTLKSNPSELLEYIPYRSELELDTLSYGEIAKLLNEKYRIPYSDSGIWSRGSVKKLLEEREHTLTIGHTGNKQAAAQASRTQKANDYAMMFKEKYLPLIDQSASYYEMARVLNRKGVPTPSGRGKWVNVSVKRVLDRIARLESENG